MKYAILGVGVLFGTVSATFAQPNRIRIPLYPDPYYRPATVAESHARGLADVIRSAGAANLLNSEAAKNYEDARKKYIDNRLHGTEAYFQMRQMNRQYRYEERGPRPTQQDIIRYVNDRKPDRLTGSELDPLTGQITWPSLLLKDEFETDREAIEQLFLVRAALGAFSADQFTALEAHIKQIRAILRSNIDDYPGHLWTKANRFLKSLGYESHFQAG